MARKNFSQLDFEFIKNAGNLVRLKIKEHKNFIKDLFALQYKEINKPKDLFNDYENGIIYKYVLLLVYIHIPKLYF